MAGPLDGIRVFDLTMWMVGPWASTQLGALGADVIHIEQPDVDWATLGAGVPPTINGTSIGYITWNMNKRGLFLDLKAEAGRATAYELLKTSDVFLVNMRPGVAERLGVGYDDLARINPQIVYCSVTGWGSSGPMAAKPGADGYANYFTGFWSVNGASGERPEVYRHFTQMDGTTGNLAVQAILMGLLARKRTGRGQKIEMNMIQASAALQTARLSAYLTTGELPTPLGSAAYSTAPDRAFLCEDQRYLGVSVTSEAEWRDFCAVIERPNLAEDQRFASNRKRIENRDALSGILEPVFLAKPQYYWMQKLSHVSVACGYPQRFEQLRNHQQALANGYIVEVETSAWGKVFTGGPPWQFSRTPAQWRGTVMPGEHTWEILEELRRDGGGKEELPRIAPQPQTTAGGGDHAPAASSATTKGPLAGYRVVEIAEGVAGPACTMQLGDAGAEIIKIELPAGDRARGWEPPCQDADSATFAALNRNKRSIVLDLESPEGMETARRLLATADVAVVDANRPSTAALRYEELCDLNPSIVYCAVSGYGPNGPWADRPAGELPAQLLSEATASLGRINDPPVRAGVDLGSMYAAIYGVQAICAALLERDRSGSGQRIDVSLFGCLLAMRSTLWVAHSNPDEWWGFHLDSYVKPPDHGYQCKDLPIYFTFARRKGVDRQGLIEELHMDWVRDDPLFEVFNADSGGGGDRYSHVVHHLWEKGFAGFTAAEVTEIIERHGGVAFPMNNYERFVTHPQVKHLGTFTEVPRTGAKAVKTVAPPWRFSDTVAGIWLPAPGLGEHTSEILQELTEQLPDNLHADSGS